MGDSPPYKRCLRYRAVTSTTSSDPHLEQLIEEVKKYPCLYNSNSLQYRDQYRKEECWDIISRIMHSSRGDLKKEWKRLRDGYRQALVTRLSGKKEAKKKVLKPWKYEEQMDFLKPYICPRSRLLVAARSPSSDNEFDYFPIKEEVISDDSSQQSASEQPSIISEFLIRSTLMNIKPDPDAPFTPIVDGKKRKKKVKVCCMPRKRAASACASKPGDNDGEGSSPNAENGDSPPIVNNNGDNGNMPSTSNSGNNGFNPGDTGTQSATTVSNNNDTGNSNNNHGDGGNASSVIDSDMIDIMTSETITNLNIMPIDKVIGPSNNNLNSNGTVPSTSSNGGTILNINGTVPSTSSNGGTVLNSNVTVPYTSSNGGTLSISNVRNNDSNSSTSNADNNGRISSASSYDNGSTPVTSDGESNDPTPSTSSPRNDGSVPSTGNAGNNSSTPLNSNNDGTPLISNAGNNGISSLNSNNGSTSTLSNNGNTSTLRNNGSTSTLRNNGSTSTLRNNGSTSTLRNNGGTESTRRNGISLLLRNARNNSSTRSASNAGNTSSLSNNGCTPSSSNNRVTTSSNRGGIQGLSAFARNLGNYVSGRRAATNNMATENSYVVFVDHDPNNQENDDQNIDELQSSSRCRTYHIQEFQPEPLPINRGGNNPCNRVTTMRDATPSNLRSSDQVYRAIQPSAGALDFSFRNNDQQLSAIQLFLASLYQTVKQMPLKYQNNIKINILEYLKVAEEEFEQIKAQRANNVPRQSQGNQENRGTLQSSIRFLGDNDPRHSALQLYLASIHESLRKMPGYLLSYMKINMLELVNNVEEIYKNSD